MPETPPLDLSKATKLKDVEFACRKSDIQWIAMTVQTATSKSLRQITVNLRPGLLDKTGERVHRELQDLDKQWIPNLQGDGLMGLVDYLDKVRRSVSLLRSTLNL